MDYEREREGIESRMGVRLVRNRVRFMGRSRNRMWVPHFEEVFWFVAAERVMRKNRDRDRNMVWVMRRNRNRVGRNGLELGW